MVAVGMADTRAANFGQKDTTIAMQAGVLTVGGVGRSAEEGSEGGGQAVTQQGAVEAGVDHEVLAAGGGDGADIADVLDHGGKGQGHDRQHGGPEDAAVDRAGEEVEHAVFPEDRQAEPLGAADGSGDGGALRGINDECEDVRAEHAEQDRDDLGHALAPHVEADDDQDRDDGDKPVGTAVGDGGRGQRQADGDDDRAGDDRREVAHDFLDAEDLEQGRQDDVHQARDGDAEACVGQQVVVIDRGAVRIRPDGAHGVVAADEGERAAEEGRDFALGQQVEQQRAEAGEQQRRCDVEAGQRRDEDGRAEHGEHVLETQNEHSGLAECTCVVHRLGTDGAFTHRFFPPVKI